MYVAIACPVADIPCRTMLVRSVQPCVFPLLPADIVHYRLLLTSPISTPSKGLKLSALHLVTSFILLSTLAEKRWEYLSTTRKGPEGRTVHEGFLPCASFLYVL